MSEGESGTATGHEGVSERRQAGRETGTPLRGYVRRALESGALAGVGGGASLLGGVRALRRGDRRRGVVRLLLGGLLVAAAVRQRRSGGVRAEEAAGVDRSDVVDTSPDVEGAGQGADLDSDVDATGVDRTDVVETGITEGDLAEAAEETEAAEGEATTAEDETAEATAAEAIEAGSYERLGEAAFDEYSSEVPVPQRAFNQEFLALDAEAFWGVREADDAVVVSQLFDPIDLGDGTRYVASSRVDDGRLLSVPNAVRNHWDDVAGGGTAVVGGDDIVFATSERLTAEGQLLVVPAGMVDDLLGESE